MSDKTTLAARSTLNDLDEILDHLSEWELSFIESVSDKLDNGWQLTTSQLDKLKSIHEQRYLGW